MKDIFNFKKNKYPILIVGILLLSFFVFLNWRIIFIGGNKDNKTNEMTSTDDSIIDSENKLFFLPTKTDFNYEYYRYYRVDDWKEFKDPRDNFSFLYPSDADDVHYVDEGASLNPSFLLIKDNDSGLEAGNYSQILINKDSENFNESYGFLFYVGVYNVNKNFSLREYITPLLTSKWDDLADFEHRNNKNGAPFMVCRSIPFKTSDAQICEFSDINFSYTMAYFLNNEKLYVVEGPVYIKESYSPELGREDNYRRQVEFLYRQRLIFRTIVSTFRVLN